MKHLCVSAILTTLMIVVQSKEPTTTKESLAQAVARLDGECKQLRTDIARSKDPFPLGAILAWVPTPATSPVPADWALCNGEAGTPDLRNKFLMGTGDSASVRSTGGRADIPNDGSHDHGAHTGLANSATNLSPNDRSYIAHSGSPVDFNITCSISGDGIHNHDGENRPPFVAVMYIMKMK